MNLVQVHVVLRADECINNKNGTVTVVLPCREVSIKDRETLQSLFPNLLDKAFDLLTKETLLDSIATEADTAKEPEKKEKNPDWLTKK